MNRCAIIGIRIILIGRRADGQQHQCNSLSKRWKTFCFTFFHQFLKCFKLTNCRRLHPSICSLGPWRVCDFQRHDSLNSLNRRQCSSLPGRALPPIRLPCCCLGPRRSLWHQPSSWSGCSHQNCQASSWSSCSQVPASDQQG